MDSTSAPPDSIVVDWMQRVKQFDADAWAELVKMGSPWVYRWCRAADVEAHEAADIVQRLFDGVSRAIGNFRREVTVDGVREWWWSITRNKIKGYYQNRFDTATADQKIGALPETAPADMEPSAGPDVCETEPEYQAALTRILEIGRDPNRRRRRRDKSGEK
jgi:DNA-directed RNA polymerase specialized sigma24 family protein